MKKPQAWSLSLMGMLLAVISPQGGLHAELPCSILDCSQMADDAEWLRCYDESVRREIVRSGQSASRPDRTPENGSKTVSYLTKLWELDESLPRNRYTLMTHRANYLLPFTHNGSPNREPVEQASPGKVIQETEVAFQISLKVKLWQDIFAKDMDLWFGYTQKSFWQLYNFSDSAPFRETNYEPELLLTFRTDYKLSQLTARIFQVGLNHQSNGRSKPLSRSWNRIVGNAGLERGNCTLLLKTWYRIPESAENDDNPEIDDTMGHGEIWAYYVWNRQRFGVMFRNNLRADDNRGALMLEWNFPLLANICGSIQYFTGYGESLLDFDHSANRIGIGVGLTDWN